jgi:hypothetical protein
MEVLSAFIREHSHEQWAGEAFGVPITGECAR